MDDIMDNQALIKNIIVTAGIINLEYALEIIEAYSKEEAIKILREDIEDKRKTEGTSNG